MFSTYPWPPWPILVRIAPISRPTANRPSFAFVCFPSDRSNSASGDALLKLSKPVEEHGDLGRGAFLGPGVQHDEPFAIRGDVVIDVGVLSSERTREEHARVAGAEDRLRGDVRNQHLIPAPTEQITAIRGPHRLAPHI